MEGDEEDLEDENVVGEDHKDAEGFSVADPDYLDDECR